MGEGFKFNAHDCCSGCVLRTLNIPLNLTLLFSVTLAAIDPQGYLVNGLVARYQ